MNYEDGNVKVDLLSKFLQYGGSTNNQLSFQSLAYMAKHYKLVELIQFNIPYCSKW